MLIVLVFFNYYYYFYLGFLVYLCCHLHEGKNSLKFENKSCSFQNEVAFSLDFAYDLGS